MPLVLARIIPRMNPRNLPRFLPTLTEVVRPAQRTKTAPDIEELVQSVIQQASPVIEQRLHEEMQAAIQAFAAEQRQNLTLRLQQELEPLVRQAVLEALASLSAPAG